MDTILWHNCSAVRVNKESGPAESKIPRFHRNVRANLSKSHLAGLPHKPDMELGHLAGTEGEKRTAEKKYYTQSERELGKVHFHVLVVTFVCKGSTLS